MAIYHCEFKIISRRDGLSATAAAAYRSASVVRNERTGATHDYSKKYAACHNEILAPEDAPAWARDRARLWNAVETAEKRCDAQLARELILSLPHELAPEAQLALARDFVRENFVAMGMVADLCLHAPISNGDERNFHAHAMLSMRELRPDGFGRKVREWNDRALVSEWRENWAKAANAALEAASVSARIDHRSLADQGVTDRIPSRHLGPAAAHYERRTGQKSNRRLRFEREERAFMAISAARREKLAAARPEVEGGGICA